MSKARYSILLVFSFVMWCTPIMGQPEPITIQFVEAQPLWEHIVYDSNFYEVDTQPNINKFTVMHPYRSIRFDQDLMILSFCVNYNGEIYGYILEQLDIITGETKWQNYSTFYNDGLQDVYQELYMRPDGQLEAIGMKRHGPYIDTIFGGWSFGYGKSNYVRKIFDYATGELTDTFIGKDSLTGILPQDLTFLPLKIDSSYLNIQFRLAEEDSTYMLFTDFYQLDKQLNIVPLIPIGSIPYDEKSSKVLSFGQPQLFERINDTTIVGLFFKDRYRPDNAVSQLLWMDISDIHDIHVIRTLETSEIVPVFKQSFAFFNFQTTNERIYITQPFKDPLTTENTSFLTIISMDGQLLHYLPTCVDDNHYYSYLKLLYSTESSDYFAAQPSMTGRSGLDFLKLGIAADSFEYISSLTSAFPDEEFTRELTVATMYEDSIVIFGAYTKKVGEVQNSAVKYYAFNASDLGIDLSTQIETIDKSNLVSIYPNPTTGLIRFDFNKTISGNIILYDQIGRKVCSYQFNGTQFYEADLNELSTGVYFAQVIVRGSLPSGTFTILRI